MAKVHRQWGATLRWEQTMRGHSRAGANRDVGFAHQQRDSFHSDSPSSTNEDGVIPAAADTSSSCSIRIAPLDAENRTSTPLTVNEVFARSREVSGDQSGSATSAEQASPTGDSHVVTTPGGCEEMQARKHPISTNWHPSKRASRILLQRFARLFSPALPTEVPDKSMAKCPSIRVSVS